MKAHHLRNSPAPRLRLDVAAKRHVAASALALLLVGPCHAGDELRNWFEDPFFRVSAAIPDCPEPAGPFVTTADRQTQSHRRAEKGTTCWLAGECDRPNAYLYDRDIAAAIHAAAAKPWPFKRSSLWVTVQGRVVYVEGCVARDSQAVEIERFVRRLPHVQQAIAIVTANPRAAVPYRLRAFQ